MSGYSERVFEIRRRFLASLPNRLADIEAILFQAEHDNPKAISTLHLKFHDLSGNAAMLGLTEVADEARKALSLVERFDNVDVSMEPFPVTEIRQSLTRLGDLSRNMATEAQGPCSPSVC